MWIAPRIRAEALAKKPGEKQGRSVDAQRAPSCVRARTALDKISPNSEDPRRIWRETRYAGVYPNACPQAVWIAVRSRIEAVARKPGKKQGRNVEARGRSTCACVRTALDKKSPIFGKPRRTRRETRYTGVYPSACPQAVWIAAALRRSRAVVARRGAATGRAGRRGGVRALVRRSTERRRGARNRPAARCARTRAVRLPPIAAKPRRARR